MTSTEKSNLQTIRAYLASIESGVPTDSMLQFFTNDIEQIELPNRLNPNGQRSNLEGLRKRSEQGRKILVRQSYEIISELAQDDRVAIEALWTAVLSIPLGTLAAGAEMKAHFAMFFKLSDGKIASQRNYDCFEAW